MKNFLLQNKWLGFVALLIYALIDSAVVSKIGIAAVEQYTPVVAQEMEQFLPITVENGEIVTPQNAVVRQSFNLGSEENKIPFNVVLDTTSNEIEATALAEDGIYVSRKFMYIVSGKNTQIQDLSDIPNGTFNKETLNAATELFVKNTHKYMFPLYAVATLIVAMIVILLFTVLMHWLMAIMFNVTFGRTLRINTLTYAVIYTVAVLSGFYVGLLAVFGIMLFLNIGVNAALKSA
ncbi:MAG: DUF1189 family protein [Alphaproteobacteria bacterium]|nr:DUF1189 family protein [Alphaproteobacteria bacterium]